MQADLPLQGSLFERQQVADNVEYRIGVLEKKTIHFTWASGKI